MAFIRYLKVETDRQELEAGLRAALFMAKVFRFVGLRRRAHMIRAIANIMLSTLEERDCRRKKARLAAAAIAKTGV